MKYLKKFESWEYQMSRSEMCDYLCDCGYMMDELDSMSDDELQMMCMESEPQQMSEKKGEKWIQDTKMKKGAFHKQLGYDEDEDIPVGVIKKIVDGEVGSKVKVKGQEKTITALMKKRANLAKTLKKLK